MHRLVLVAVFLAGCTGCSKQTKEKPDNTMAGGTPDKVQVPGAKGGATVGGAQPESTVSPVTDTKRLRLQPEEGNLAIEAPADAKAGAETTAKVVITAGEKYKVNTEYPTKLTLQNADGVTIAKAELKAGGMEKEKGDAEVFDESKLTFAVKLTPAKSGSYTINGSFKFAVCDKAGSTCLPKKEPIAIQVAAQ
jgi:hypothetical protein